MARQWVFENGILYARNPHLPGVHLSPRVNATFGEVKQADAGLLAVAMGTPDTAVIQMRLATRRRCFAAWVENRIVAYAWVSERDECIGEQEREMRLEAHEAYIWDCVTLPECRGLGLYSALLVFMNDSLRREGVQRIWIGSSQSNIASLKGFARAGFQPVVTLVYLRLFNLRLCLAWGYSTAPSPLVAAARRALITDDERAYGPFFLGWSSQPPVSPCAGAEPNPRSI